MEKLLTVDFVTDEDQWGCVTSEEIHGMSDNGTEINFYVHDLSECPEDAILGRDLFSGAEYLEAIELGMKLAQEGYTGIECNCIKEEDYYDDDDDDNWSHPLIKNLT